MSDIVLGKLIKGPAERDAIHIAVVPLIAAEQLFPGEQFRLLFGTTDTAIGVAKGKGIGIADPFMDESIKKGERFWGVLHQNTVTGMRHHWQHPDFPDESLAPVVKGDKDESELWLRQFCDRWYFAFDKLIDAGTSTDDWRYVVADGIDCHSAEDLGEDHDLFWHHLQVYTGQSFSQEHRDEMGWSCSC